MDVVLGRESLNAWQQGTHNLIESIEARLEEYIRVKERAKKSEIIQCIYNQAAALGRFLVRDPNGDAFIHLDEKEAKEKISHMIRYRKRKFSNVLSTQEKPRDDRTSVVACSDAPSQGAVQMQNAEFLRSKPGPYEGNDLSLESYNFATQAVVVDYVSRCPQQNTTEDPSMSFKVNEFDEEMVGAAFDIMYWDPSCSDESENDLLYS